MAARTQNEKDSEPQKQSRPQGGRPNRSPVKRVRFGEEEPDDGAAPTGLLADGAGAPITCVRPWRKPWRRANSLRPSNEIPKGAGGLWPPEPKTKKTQSPESKAALRAANQTGAQRSGAGLGRRNRMTELPPPAFWPAAQVRRTSVFASGENLGAGRIYFARAMKYRRV